MLLLWTMVLACTSVRNDDLGTEESGLSDEPTRCPEDLGSPEPGEWLIANYRHLNFCVDTGHAVHLHLRGRVACAERFETSSEHLGSGTLTDDGHTELVRIATALAAAPPAAVDDTASQSCPGNSQGLTFNQQGGGRGYEWGYYLEGGGQSERPAELDDADAFGAAVLDALSTGTPHPWVVPDW
ncbi:MAG: hypothetical protein EP330_14405 [Deltaproteobacteria bacterium]|nr:MAG: hypothetical protein EP330_14405 [Deltaproteobacteria bacterium]